MLRDDLMSHLAQTGCRDAWGELCQLLRPLALSHLKRFPSVDRDDVIQDAFIVLYQSRLTFRIGAAVSPWFFTLFRRVALGHIRQSDRINRRRVTLIDVPEIIRDEPIEFTAIMALLPADDHWWLESLANGQTLADLAPQLGTSKATLHRRLQRLRASVRSSLD